MGLNTARGTVLIGSTAEGAAMLRAAGSLWSAWPLRGPDHLAAQLIPWSPTVSAAVKVPVLRHLVGAVTNTVLPGMVTFEAGRTTFMDRVVREQLAAGTRQVVLLGAGLDSRAYRMPELRSPETTVFEVDHPVTAAVKAQRVEAAFGHRPDGPTSVLIDFTTDDLATCLADGGYRADEPAVVVWSGVAPYLPPAAVDAILAWFAGQHADSQLTFDYLWAEALDGTVSTPVWTALRRLTDRQGEPMRSGIPANGIAEFLAERGLAPVEPEYTVDTALREAGRDRGALRRLGSLWRFGGILRVTPA